MRPIFHLGAVICAFSLVLPLAGADRTEKEKEKEKDANAGKSLDRLMKEAKNFDPAIRNTAIRSIGQMGPEATEAIPLLVDRVLRDLDPGVSADAMIALRLICNEKHVKEIKELATPLTKTLRNGTPPAKANAAMLLGMIGPDGKAAITPLMEVTLKSTAWEIRKAGAFALGRVAYEKKEPPEQAVVNALTKLVYNDECAQVRLEAMQALAALGAHRTQTEAQAHVVKHTLEFAIRKNRDPSEVLWAHTMLAQTIGTKPDEHIIKVIELLKPNVDPAIRANAIRALGVIGSVPKKEMAKLLTQPGLLEKLLSLLIDALKDRDDAVGANAAAALAQVKDNLEPKMVALIAQILTSPTEPSYARVRAAQCLGLLGDKSAKSVDILIRRLADKDLDVAYAAAQSLGHMGQTKGLIRSPDLEAIVAMMNDHQAPREARFHAAIALGQIGERAESTIPALIATIQDSDGVVAGHAAASLALMRRFLKPNHVADVAAIMAHKDPVVRMRAIQLLGYMDENAKPFLPNLINALQDSDPGVVKNAIMILSQMGQSMDKLDQVEEALKPMKEHSDKDVKLTASQALSVLAKFRQTYTKP